MKYNNQQRTLLEKFVNSAWGLNPPQWPLPEALEVEHLWHRAHAGAIQGYYASAFSDLTVIKQRCATQRWQSLTYSTQGSFLRQLGYHTYARTYDGYALRLSGFPHDSETFEAACDALVGLTADAIGLGRLKLAERLLQRVNDFPEKHLPLRCQIYRYWVATELAMAQEKPKAAITYAQQALVVAEQFSCSHHNSKTKMMLAAALNSAGQQERSRDLAYQTLIETEKYGFVPLSWALCCLLCDLEKDQNNLQQLFQRKKQYAQIVTNRGGDWCS